MPLFTTNRDSGFIKGINRELLHGVISTEIGVYKIDLEKTEINMYGESERKVYHPPIRLFGLVRRERSQVDSDEYGMIKQKEISVGLMKDDLIKKELYLEVGDIIEYDTKFYEIDNIYNDNYWSGMNPDQMIGTKQDGWKRHGYHYSVIIEGHLTDVNPLHINDQRKGRNINNIKPSIPGYK